MNIVRKVAFDGVWRAARIHFDEQRPTEHLRLEKRAIDV